MLSKKYRLPVQSVLGIRGTVRRSRYFLMKIFPAAVGYPRLGVVVSTAVASRATVRNRLRRLIYTAGRALLPKAQLADYLVIIQPPAAAADAANGMIKELELFLRS